MSAPDRGERNADDTILHARGTAGPERPPPRGPASYDWVDAQRAEIYSPDPQDRRELVLWVWYPAAPAPDAERVAYLPEPWAPTGQFLGLDATGLRSNAIADAPVATDQSTYPVLVMSPSGFPPLLLAAIGEEFASHGYVVVGVNHTRDADRVTADVADHV